MGQAISLDPLPMRKAPTDWLAVTTNGVPQDPRRQWELDPGLIDRFHCVPSASLFTNEKVSRSPAPLSYVSARDRPMPVPSVLSAFLPLRSRGKACTVHLIKNTPSVVSIHLPIHPEHHQLGKLRHKLFHPIRDSSPLPFDREPHRILFI